MSYPRLLLAAALLAAGPAVAKEAPPPAPAAQAETLSGEVGAILAQAPKGTRFGLLVVDEDGREVIAVDPDQRFVPASTTKLFTTAAALALFAGAGEAAAGEGGITLALVPRPRGASDVVLRGGGGVSLSTASDCLTRCLISLASQIAQKTRKVRDVIVDPGAFPGPRWSPGMSWNNIGTPSGTAVSALMVDDNVALLEVRPGDPGKPPVVAAPGWFTITNRALTVEGGSTALRLVRAVNSRELAVAGTIALDASPWRARLGIDDPAGFGAWALAQALRAMGIKVTGAARVEEGAGAALGEPLAAIPAVPLGEEVARINKDSQNVHAEALLRRLGIVAAAPLPPASGAGGGPLPGSLEAGLAAMRAALAPAEIPAAGFDLHDGSGMSSYNRLSPAATVALLRWARAQPWAESFLASLALAGTDGTLARRFTATPLAGRLSAKTGTLNAASALAGYLTAASGKRLTFAIFANDYPEGAAVTALMDRALLAVAAGE